MSAAAPGAEKSGGQHTVSNAPLAARGNDIVKHEAVIGLAQSALAASW